MANEKEISQFVWKNSTWEENISMLKITSPKMNLIEWNTDVFNGMNAPIGYYDNDVKIIKTKYERYIKLPKKICSYLKLEEAKITLEKLSNALELKSNSCKSNYNYHSNSSTMEYVFCNEGKQIFQLKSNMIIKHCLLDLLLYKYNNLPKCDFYDYYQEPVDVKHIILNNLKIDI